jgi:hypothetical protein
MIASGNTGVLLALCCSYLINESLASSDSLTPLLDTPENEEWVQFPAEGVEF